MIRNAIALCLSLLAAGLSSAQTSVRPPAVPLVTCDPYFSIWSEADRLTDRDTTHWTGKSHRLFSTVTVDGQRLRLMGTQPESSPALPQTKLSVLPTRTIYEFAGSGIALQLTFMTPALPHDMDLLSWPVTYVTYEVSSTDGKSHTVKVDFEASAEIAVNQPQQATTWTKPDIAGLTVQCVGSVEQPVLARSGDDLRIDWGYLYVACSDAQPATWSEHQLKLDFGTVSNQPVKRWLMLAYDDLYSIQYLQSNLRPYWRRNGLDAAGLLTQASQRYEELSRSCQAFDTELLADMSAVGGDDYAALCALCYRQCLAAGKFCADANGQPLQFSKENHSNGCVATSDVFYPMAPQFLLFGPSVAKSFIVPFMNYAASERWKFPFAPHDLGQYPLANGQVYGGGEHSEENQMPVEECGNLLLLFGAVAQMEGNADFAGLYWKQLDAWASYLLEKGFDPENQLCTDDFAGHLAHNVNLSAKAICALGAFSKLCKLRGESEKADRIHTQAKSFAERWIKEAADGDHYRLAFDRSGTWSQKYNLIWDRILDLNLFPREVAKQEMAYYRSKQNEFGLPLDNRKEYTKLDWILWTATLTQDRADFDALLKPVMHFINGTSNRSPLTDWYNTTDAKKIGFTARPVVGGVFVQALYYPEIWKKWASRDLTKSSNWAAAPKPPVVTDVVPTAVTAPAEWSYTTEKPAERWNQPDFDVSDWKKGKSGFGTRETPSTVIGTEWSTSDIWIVRDVEIGSDQADNLHWSIHHDENAQIYLNGHPVAQFSGYSVRYEQRKLTADALRSLKPGKNRIAVHCHQTSGGQYIDVGLVSIVPVDSSK